MNNITSKLIYILIVVQPVMYYLSSLMETSEYNMKNANDYLFLIPFYIFICLLLFIDLYKKDLFKITYLTNSCTNICRLSWDFFGYNKSYYSVIYGILFLLYLSISYIFWKKSTIEFVSISMLLIALFYTMFFNKKQKSFMPIFASIYCFLGVTYGPITLINYYLNPSYYK
jgi:hypothetical protein